MTFEHILDPSYRRQMTIGKIAFMECGGTWVSDGGEETAAAGGRAGNSDGQASEDMVTL